jgi:lipopolysaccharide/colanic/teichoic acid biosynthesis glycosyltransferase
MISLPQWKYVFDYETNRLGGSMGGSGQRRRKLSEARQARAIRFADRTGAYFFDLRARHPVAALVKRSFDIVFAAAVILVLSPLLLLLVALIRFTSPGPVIFRQRRIGFRCNPFDMYKFRTMTDGAHLQEKELAAGTGRSFLKLKNDSRITFIGGFLRKYSLDELPQFFNVLQGSMSLVGPRPLLLSDLDKLPRRSSLSRFSMPPGMTGLWQVSGRSTCGDVRRMQLDRRYVNDWTLALDAQILLRTIGVVIAGNGAV